MKACLRGKLETLQEELFSLQPGLIAVSGGVDSRFLLHAALLNKFDFQAVFFSGPLQTPLEKAVAVNWLLQQKVAFHVIFTDPLQVNGVGDNSVMRCYHCKRAMFGQALQLSRKLGLQAVLDGTQADDTREYRPGLRALQEIGIHSPLAVAGLTKNEIREIARELGLDSPEQPSRPCLLTRFSYGLTPSEEELVLVARAEAMLYDAGFENFRLRVLPERIVLQLAVSERKLWEEHKEAMLLRMRSIGIDIGQTFFSEKVSGFFDRA